MEVIINVLLKANDDLVVCEVNVKIFHRPAPVNLCLPTSRHKQDWSCISGLKT